MTTEHDTTTQPEPTETAPALARVLERLDDTLTIIGAAHRAASRWEDPRLKLTMTDYFWNVIGPIRNELRQTDPESLADDLATDRAHIRKIEADVCGQPGPGKVKVKGVDALLATRRQLLTTAAAIIEAVGLLWYPVGVDALPEGSRLHSELGGLTTTMEGLIMELAVLLSENADEPDGEATRHPDQLVEIGEGEVEVWRAEDEQSPWKAAGEQGPALAVV